MSDRNISLSQTVIHLGILEVIINDFDFKILLWIVYSILCQAVDVFGVGSNLINIICFVKQGFKDPVNISLLGLAVSDFIACVTLLWSNICSTPAFIELDLPFQSLELQYLTGGMPHTVFAHITSWITAFITVERCLCIAAPLKVKTILTTKLVFIITVSIYIINIGSITPEYIVNRFEGKFYPERNKTIIGLVYNDNLHDVTKVSYVVNNVLLPYSSFLIVIICTIVLVSKLRENAKWRKSSIHFSQADTVSNRNQKVSKMVVMISTLFILCFIPLSLVFLGASLEPNSYLNSKYRNLFIILGGVGLFFESVNSASNIFIYYHMSAKYRVVFLELFKRTYKSQQ